MPDVFFKKKRCKVILAIRYKNTKLELDATKMLHQAKIRCRPHPKIVSNSDI